jgi:hypothetical protein
LNGGRIEVGGDEGDEVWNATLGKWVGIDESICLYGTGVLEEYYDDELKTDLDTLHYGTLIFASSSCFSGGLIDDISAPNRIIMTAANETYTAQGDLYYEEGGYNGSDRYGEWSEVLIDALHGKDTYFDLEKWLVIHKSVSVDADSNNDGHVSINEAWEYAWQYDDARLHGDETNWFDDNGNHRPTYLNETEYDAPRDPNDGIFASTTWFPQAWPADVVRDGVIDIFDLVTVALLFGSNVSDPKWNSVADIVEDNVVDIFDVVAVALEFGNRSQLGTSSTSSNLGTKQALPEGTTSVSVYPSTITVYKHEIFSVNIAVNDVTGLYGWELKLYWNNALLNCASAQIYVPSAWGQNVFEAGSGIENGFNATHGRYFEALSALNPAPAFNGSMTIVTLTFEAKATGTTTLDLQETKLSDISACAISHSTTDGSVTVLPPTWFMRGDQHTVNSLTAYKLWKPQSTTMRSYYESKPIWELSAQWGIQVWKRSQGGTETAISSGIVAQVTRANPGQGLQSATWNCPETSLNPTDAIVVRVYQRFEGYSWQPHS